MGWMEGGGEEGKEDFSGKGLRYQKCVLHVNMSGEMNCMSSCLARYLLHTH